MRLALPALLVLFFVASTSRAVPTEAARLVAEAQEAERRFDPARAESLYEAAIEADPTARVTRLARRRLGWLRARSEEGYEPLRILMKLRAEPPAGAELDRITERVHAFPRGLVRRESLAVVGDAQLAEGDVTAALAAYEALLASPDVNEAERQIAHAKAALARAERDGPSASLDDLRRAGLGDRAEATALRARRIGEGGTPIAIALLVLFAALGVVGTRGRGLRHLRQAWSPRRLALGAWLLAVPLGFVALYDRLLVAQFAPVVAALAAILALACVIGAGEPTPPLRRVLVPLAPAAVFAAAFLALDRSRLLFDLLWSLEQSPH